MSRRISHLSFFLLALFLAAGALRAQLDPRLEAGRTDFLNLYQQSTTTKPKPEIVAIFDFSGSMTALMYHSLYQNLSKTDGDGKTTISFAIQTNSNNPITNVNCGTSGTASSNLSVALSTTNTSLTLQFQNLIKPDGSIVTAADADQCTGLQTSSGAWIVRPANASVTNATAVSPGLYTTTVSATARPNRDVRHWIMAASHARFKCTAVQSNVPSTVVGRTIDIPLPWKIVDFHSTGNPLKSKTIRDQQIKVSLDAKGNPETKVYGSGQDIEFDLSYMVAGGTSGTSLTNSFGSYTFSTSTTVSYVSFGTCYNPYYVHWLFAGRWQNSTSMPNNSANNYITGNGTNNGTYYTTDAALVGKFIAFDAGTDNTRWAAGQTSGEWGQGFRAQTINTRIKVPKYKNDGSYDGTFEDYAFRYYIPALTRVQANKLAAIQTWVKHQADVYWAFRFLDTSASEYSVKTINNDSRSLAATGDPLVTKTNGITSGWIVLNNTPTEGINAANGNSVKGMKRIAATFASGNTPLTYAMARSLAQYNDSNNVFNDVMKPEDVSQCSSSFIILFTDGVDNQGTPTTATPYLDGTTLSANFNPATGNKKILDSPASIETTWFNLFTYAAMGAHMADSSLGSGNYKDALTPTTGTAKKNIRDFIPFAVKGRKGATYGSSRRVTTMTVGVSLGGKLTEADGPKRGMFLGAVMGDTDINGGRLSDYHGFRPPTFNPDGTVDQYNDWLEDPTNSGGYPNVGKRAHGAVYFFDATDPDSLSASLETAFQAAISAGSNNATSSPNLPFVGASLGGQVYMGSFVVPEGGGVIWTGDLCMFGTREESGGVQIINKFGNVATSLDAGNASWAASEAMKEKPWRNRKLYTRLPGETVLKKFTDDGTDFTNSTSGLVNYIGTNPKTQDGVLAAKRAVQFAAGGEADRGPFDANDRPVNNRNTIMGDIINSAPSAIEFEWSSVSSKLSAYPRLAGVNGDRFRLILVGTNQGWVHAFGEVSKIIEIEDVKGVMRQMVTGNVEELWAFMPTDFLKELEYITHPNNLHRFMADGSASIYHLDIPPSSGGIGNGIVDAGERVLAVFGLGKGGRSYYALNIEDPFEPKIQWTLVPDEAASFPSSRLETNSNISVDNFRNILGSFGFSTATPAFGRIVYDGGSKKLKDAVFLSGGFSVPEVDDRFPDRTGKPTPLGRSVVAMDVYSGNVLAAEDLTSKFGSAVGPVGSGLIPFEFIVNSGTAQRAYFMDYYGGLYAWGAEELVTTAGSLYQNFHVDSSEINKWKLRKVYQDSGTARGNRYTTAIAPFRVGNFTGKSKNGAVVPAAVGIAVVSGDRNNPLDFDYNATTNIAPINHRLTVLFDRQDGENYRNANGMLNGVITDNALMNFSYSVVTSTPSDFCTDAIFRAVTPGCDDYYLSPKTGDPKFGYYINFPVATGGFIPKGINPPTVVSGSLFYTFFTPAAADPCAGGFGLSSSWVIADVVNPLKDDKRGGAQLFSGQKNEWGGVASNYIQLGTRGVLQGGVPAGGGEGGGALDIKSTGANPSEGFPKPRVWRVIRQ